MKLKNAARTNKNKGRSAVDGRPRPPSRQEAQGGRSGTSRRERRDVLRQCQSYARNGWYPVPQGHLPPEIRQALRRLGIRPAMKECFQNCQRFMLGCSLDEPELAARLTYCEGFISGFCGRVDHAWLLLDGAVLDLTLGPEDGLNYDQRHTATDLEIARSWRARRYFAPVKLDELQAALDLGTAGADREG